MAGAALLALALGVYWPALAAGTVWDDGLFVFENAVIRSPGGLRDIWLTTRLMDYYPVTSSLFWLEWRLFGPDPAPYHGVQVALHALSALVAWRVLRRLAVPGAFVAAAAFAVHPVAVEVAAWISETKTTLSFLLFGLALGAYLRFEEGERPRWYAAALGLFLLALLAKTSVVALPAVLLLLAWWRRGRIGREDLWRSLPFFGLSLALGLLTVQQQQLHAIGTLEVRPEGLASRVAAAGWGLCFYAWKLLVPVRLSAVYPRWEVDPSWPPAWAPLAAALALAALAWRGRAGPGRPCLAAFGYFALMLAPVLGFVAFGFHRYSLVADHLVYPAMIGPVALAVAAAARWLEGRRPAAWQRAGLALALLAPLAALAQQRVHVFHDHQSLWSATLAANPRAWVAHYNLGVAIDRAGDSRAAIPHFRRVLELHPEHAEAHDALGRALRRDGRLDEAIPHHRRAIELEPRFAAAHNHLGNALRARGDLEGAIRHYRLALEIAPDLEEARVNLERALREQDRTR